MAQYIGDADIGIRYKSDHNPISNNLMFVEHERGRGNGKFNYSLPGAVGYVDLIQAGITETVNQYQTSYLNQSKIDPALIQFFVLTTIILGDFRIYDSGRNNLICYI